jgi:putative zinc finger protein
MNCHSFMNVLDLYREGRLSPRRAKAAAAHLASCAACRALAEPAPAAPASARAPESLRAKLLAAAKAGPEAASASAVKTAATDLPLWPREARGIALAAAALLIAGVFVALAGAPSQSAGGAVAAVEEP